MTRRKPLTEQDEDIIVNELVGKLTDTVTHDLLTEPTVQLKQAMKPMLDELHFRADTDTVTISYHVHLGVKYLRNVLRNTRRRKNAQK